MRAPAQHNKCDGAGEQQAAETAEGTTNDCTRFSV
jgi:hypothetical protein